MPVLSNQLGSFHHRDDGPLPGRWVMQNNESPKIRDTRIWVYLAFPPSVGGNDRTSGSCKLTVNRMQRFQEIPIAKMSPTVDQPTTWAPGHGTRNHQEARLEKSRTVHDLPSPVVMMGVPFDQVDTGQTLDRIDEMIASGQSHQIATANVDFLTLAQSDNDLHRILTNADLVLCDGMPLVWMSRFLGNPLPERVAGSELVPLLLERAAMKGYRVFILGGAEESLRAATGQIQRKWPTLALAGTYSPPFAPLAEMDHESICQRIRNAKPDILLVAFGCPKQEKWLSVHLAETGVPVGIGVGATIDFLAGTVKQAPRWMRASSLEWIWRIAQEPRRLFFRYAKDACTAGPGLLKQFWMMSFQASFIRRQGHRADKITPSINEAAPNHEFVALPTRLDASDLKVKSFAGSFEKSDSAWLLVDASRNTHLDSTAVGRLLRLARVAKQRNGNVILIQASQRLSETLKMMRLLQFFTFADSAIEALQGISQEPQDPGTSQTAGNSKTRLLES